MHTCTQKRKQVIQVAQLSSKKYCKSSLPHVASICFSFIACSNIGHSPMIFQNKQKMQFFIIQLKIFSSLLHNFIIIFISIVTLKKNRGNRIFVGLSQQLARSQQLLKGLGESVGNCVRLYGLIMGSHNKIQGRMSHLMVRYLYRPFQCRFFRFEGQPHP